MTVRILDPRSAGSDPHARLVEMLDASRPGDVVRVDDSLEILCNEGTAPKPVLEIKAGVTLASGRGNYRMNAQGVFEYSPGAMLFTRYPDPPDDGPEARFGAFIRVSGPNARLVGFRISGAPRPLRYLRVSCIDVAGADYSVFESCDITTPGHGITLNRCRSVVIRNCTIHGHRVINPDPHHVFAYGIFLGAGPTYVLVENNYFSDNWHGISSNGETDTGYEARGNFVEAGHGSAFDIHPHPLDRGTGRIEHNNCQYMYIHGNVFLNAGARGVLLRGIPAQSLTVQRNFFIQNEADAVAIGTGDQDVDIGDKRIESGNIYNGGFFPTAEREDLTKALRREFGRSLTRMLCPSLEPRS